ncbi:hypothetical protein [Virgibacillus litoralis]|uniref:Uncharacterized protein n=1 Tax=Virgibacillus litoralis TaxID=578221 RepID=A0ABS4HCB1_9BACI|nr:hypothetical protein [Virgibacillus litoralis]MBP1948379.1 hypothetical protein [Virgibacillus litoralis]
MGELFFTLFYGSGLILIGLFAKFMVNRMGTESETSSEKKSVVN